MDTLKRTKGLILISVILTSCYGDPKVSREDYKHKNIMLDQWNLKKNPIHKVSLTQYNKSTNFSSKIKEYELDTIFDYTESHNAVFLHFSSPILTNKDYKLVINDSINYKINNISTSYIIKTHIPSSIDSIYNLVKSMDINGKEFVFDEPRVFILPKELHTIEE